MLAIEVSVQKAVVSVQQLLERFPHTCLTSLLHSVAWMLLTASTASSQQPTRCCDGGISAAAVPCCSCRCTTGQTGAWESCCSADGNGTQYTPGGVCCS